MTTLSEFFSRHLLGNREKAVAVVDKAHYLGVMRIEELRAVPEHLWPTALVGEHMRTDLPVVTSTMSVREALTLMERVDVDFLPVLEQNAFVGVVTTARRDPGPDGRRSLIPAHVSSRTCSTIEAAWLDRSLEDESTSADGL